MEFSEKFAYTSALEYSPDGRLFASVRDTKLTIRDTETLDVAGTFKCTDVVSRLAWSRDSKFVMCAQYKRGVVQVFSADDAKWTCKISEGVAGISGARWDPSGRSIITTQKFQLQMTIWSLSENKRWAIDSPKFADKGQAFSNDGKFFAVAERKKSRDYIGVYHCETWQLVKHFQVDTVDLEDISWSPDDSSLAIWDTNLEYNLLVYSPDGRKLAQYQPYEGKMGVKRVVWSKSGKYLAIGSYDEKLRLLNNLSWQKISEYDHPPRVTQSFAVVYREDPDKPAAEAEAKSKASGPAKKKQRETKGPTVYRIARTPMELREVKPDPTSSGPPKMGVGLVEWSADDRFMLTRNDNVPNAAWIWNMTVLSLTSVVVNEGPIRCAKWNPARSSLAIAAGTDKLYMWSEEGCSIVKIPEKTSRCGRSSGAPTETR